MISEVWDLRFIRMAYEVASWSKDPSSKIGAVAVSDSKRVLGTGYNGFPAGDADSLEDYYSRSKKYPKVIHAEVNLILNCLAAGIPLTGANLYVYGQPVCPECSKFLANTGISSLNAVWDHDSKKTSGWSSCWKETSLPILSPGMTIRAYHYPDRRDPNTIATADKSNDGWVLGKLDGSPSITVLGKHTIENVIGEIPRYPDFDETLLEKRNT